MTLDSLMQGINQDISRVRRRAGVGGVGGVGGGRVRLRGGGRVWGGAGRRGAGRGEWGVWIKWDGERGYEDGQLRGRRIKPVIHVMMRAAAVRACVGAHTPTQGCLMSGPLRQVAGRGRYGPRHAEGGRRAGEALPLSPCCKPRQLGIM